MVDLLDLHQELHRGNGFVLDPLLEFLRSVVGEERVNDDKGNADNADGQGGEIEKYLATDSHRFNEEPVRYLSNSHIRSWS